MPTGPDEARWPLAVALILWLGVAALSLLWPQVTAPEQAAGLGALAALTLGPAGAVLWLVPAGVVVWRSARLIRPVARR